MGASLVAGVVGGAAYSPAEPAGWLREAGYTVHLYDGDEPFRQRVAVDALDLVLLDGGAPEDSALVALEWLRHSPHARLPAIVITARGDEEEIVRCLRCGADDCCVVPLRRHELVARVEALLRRSGRIVVDPVLRQAPPYEIDVASRRVTIGGSDVRLTEREFDLASFLFRRLGHVVTRQTLLSQVWNVARTLETRTVDTHVSRVRKKLALNGTHGWALNAVYQHGYRLERG